MMEDDISMSEIEQRQTRRSFLGTAVAGGAALVLPVLSPLPTSAAPLPLATDYQDCVAGCYANYYQCMAGAGNSRLTKAACQAALSGCLTGCAAAAGASAVSTGVQAVGTWIYNNRCAIIGTTVVIGVVVLVVATDGAGLIFLAPAL